ncbi:MAG: tetratricopeptide repeat protein [Spirochaetales bacterium]|nr:tetratricopeptide repeat protein [Spirochaetales bacterium]
MSKSSSSRPLIAATAVLLAALAGPLAGQPVLAPPPSTGASLFGGSAFDAGPFVLLPLGASADTFGTSFGADATAAWRLGALPPLSLGASAGYLFGATDAPETSLSVVKGAASLSWELRLSRSFAMIAGGQAGWFVASLNGGGAPAGSNPFAAGALSLEFDPSRTFGVLLSGGYAWYGGLESGATAGLSLRLRPETKSGGKPPGGDDPDVRPLSGDGSGVDPAWISLDTVYPVFHSYYDSEPFGTLRVRNLEVGEARNVVARVMVKQYMDEPKSSEPISRLAPGASADIRLVGLFSDRLLSVAEGTKVPVSIELEYRQYGTLVREEYIETLVVGNRNALVWDDDRKAAAFVSSKDPEAFRVSRAIATAVKDAYLPGLNLNLQVAIAAHEGLRQLRLAYQVDPSSSITSGRRGSVDFLQFPQQTLAYRSGDCDDLSILYASVLESLGVPAAFLTVPGHILVAVDLGIGRYEAERLFQRPGDLVESGGTMWLPIETTVQGKSFTYAWDEGARQWRDGFAKGSATLIPVRDAWKTFPAVVLPGTPAATPTPPERATLGAFRTELAAILARELDSRVAALQAEFKRTGDAAVLNRLGVLYARYGQFDKAEAQFLESAKRKESVAVLYNLGNLAFAAGRMADALAWYQKAVKKGDDARAWLGVARAQAELGRFAEAATSYAKVKALDSALAERFAYLGLSSTETGRASAADAARRVIEWTE